MSFGLGLGGLQIKRLADIKPEIEEAFGTAFGVGNIDLSADGPIGQLVGILADREASLWELFEDVVTAMNETGASGAMLDQLYLLVNMLRLRAEPTRTIASDGVTPTTLLTGTPGTVVPVNFALETSDTGARFLLVEEVTIPGGGTVLAEFAADAAGPIQCLSGTLTEIPVPLVGLTSATNTQDAQVGRLTETDSAFRARKSRASALVSASSTPAILAAILALEGVIEVREIVNRSDSSDLDDRPGHSYELVIRGGEDQEILDEIFRTQPAGIETVGNVTGFSTDSHGDSQPVAFSRPDVVPIYFVINLTVDGNFPADGLVQVRDAILAYEDQLTEGLTISPFKIEQTIETPGIVVFEMLLSTGMNPSSDDPIEIAQDAIADFDSTRLTVQRVN
jgi:hypothetical protein